jgi:hypothetical protein
MNSVFNYIKANRNIDTTISYPYRAVVGPCKYLAAGAAANVTGYINVAANELALQTAVSNVGPISVAIYVSQNFMYYRSGIYNDLSCNTYAANHAGNFLTNI